MRGARRRRRSGTIRYVEPCEERHRAAALLARPEPGTRRQLVQLPGRHVVGIHHHLADDDPTARTDDTGKLPQRRLLPGYLAEHRDEIGRVEGRGGVRQAQRIGTRGHRIAYGIGPGWSRLQRRASTAATRPIASQIGAATKSRMASAVGTAPRQNIHTIAAQSWRRSPATMPMLHVAGTAREHRGSRTSPRCHLFGLPRAQGARYQLVAGIRDALPSV